jgi:hypothetical protein
MLMDKSIKAALWTRHWPGAMGLAVQGQATAAHQHNKLAVWSAKETCEDYISIDQFVS